MKSKQAKYSMTTKPKTIDNLGGKEYHDKIATNIELTESLRPTFKDISIITSAEINVTVPSYPSEVDELLGTQKKNSPFALFIEPKNFIRKRDLFSFLLVPSLGHFPADKLKEEIENQRKKSDSKPLIKFVKRFKMLNDFLEKINGKRNEYHKG